jgi:hypothetical protein
MDNQVSGILEKSEGYRDLKDPVILTGGDLGIYFINTEKTVGDDGEWKQYGDNPQAMIQHAIKMMDQNPDFGKIIDALVNKVMPIGESRGAGFNISGGQRRDWLFSGPVSARLGYPHIALFKDGRALLLSPDAQKVLDFGKYNTGKLIATHVSDLVTRGSSAYDPRNEPPTGWIPMLRERAIEVEYLTGVVDRLQGGRETLKQAGVNLFTLVDINEEFMDEHSKQPEIAKAYLRDPRAWSENYIREKGIEALVGTFNPDGAKLDRAKKFLAHYEDVLKESGRWQELDKAVQKEFGCGLEYLQKLGK